MKRSVTFLVFFLTIISFCFALSEGNEKLIDTPTGDILQNREVQFGFVFEKEGSVANSIEVGLFDWMSIGGGFRVLRLIGEDEVKLEDPYFLAKFQLTPDDGKVPAIAIGWDDSDYYIPVSSGPDATVERGLYLSISKQLVQQDYFGLKLSGGIHSPVINSSGVGLFMGVKFNIGEKLSISIEGDDLLASG
ncbi:MAG TPA: hypothetical protein ENN73_05060, partial [Firmicutes bacterium]|nr:hypothetical protein [Bacillota bacterium]